MKVAVERKSSVLNSNAVHHRVDSATGAAALLAIIAANVWPQVAYLDSVGGLAISAMVIAAGWNNTMAAFRELADRGIDNEIKASITKAAEKSIREHLDSVGEAFDDCVLRDVQGTKSGQNYLIDLEIAVPTHFTVTEMRRLEEAVRHTVGAKVRGVRRVKIRFIGMENDNTSLFDEFIPREVTQSIPLEQKDENGNGHSHDHDHAHEHSIGTIKKKL